jgi:hypothetical protein
VRCSVYQDKFNRNADDNLSAHFFFAIRNNGSNLTPKISELEVVNVIGGHYPNYIQHGLLTPNSKP